MESKYTIKVNIKKFEDIVSDILFNINITRYEHNIEFLKKLENIYFENFDSIDDANSWLGDIDDSVYNYIDFEVIDTKDIIKTKCDITLIDKDGKQHIVDWDAEKFITFEVIEFIWFDGNYGCDCNRQIFINGKYSDDVECGEKIKLKYINIKYE